MKIALILYHIDGKYPFNAQAFIEWIMMMRHGRLSPEFYISLLSVFMFLIVLKWVWKSSSKPENEPKIVSVEFFFYFFLSPKLINDAFGLARHSYSNYEIAIEIAAYLENEIEYAPWSVAFKYFERILSRFKLNELHIFEVL